MNNVSILKKKHFSNDDIRNCDVGYDGGKKKLVDSAADRSMDENLTSWHREWVNYYE